MQKTAAGRIVAGVIGGVAVATMAWPSSAWAGMLGSPGCFDGGAPASVTGVDMGPLLRLADGRTVRLAGIHADEGDATRIAAVARASLATWLAHATVRVAPLRGEPDRWGRTVALVFAAPRTGTDAFLSVGEAVLDAGFATAEPDPALEACWPTYIRLENAARLAHEGLWSGTDAVLAPADRAALARHLGAWSLVEGQVGDVREGRARTYVRFSDDSGSGFAVVLDRATARRLANSGNSPQSWVGRRLLVRGVPDDRWGLQIEVDSLQQIMLTPP